MKSKLFAAFNVLVYGGVIFQIINYLQDDYLRSFEWLAIGVLYALDLFGVQITKGKDKVISTWKKNFENELTLTNELKASSSNQIKILKSTLLERDEELKCVTAKHQVQKENIRECLKLLADREKEIREVRSENLTWIDKCNQLCNEKIKLEKKIDELKNIKNDNIPCPKCKLDFSAKDKILVKRKYSYVCKKCEKEIYEATH